MVALLALAFLATVAAADADSPSYQRLQGALELYLQIADRGGWPSVPDGPTLAPGDLDPRVAVLARRLRASGDLAMPSLEPALFGNDLRAAVLRFQARHGLVQDALVGPATLQALNVPVERRIAQIRLNLERARQLFTAARRDFVLVNVPAFETYIFRNGAPVWSGRVIVGETASQTPLFESHLASVVLNPTWTVPRSIASEELLLSIQRDPGFLERGGFDVFGADGAPVDPAQVEWASLHADHFPFTLVQRPGPLNELGRVKFIVPNPYGVCLHDTPSRHLFGSSSRALSHGCIRLHRPLDFALQVLAAEGWSRQQIEAGLASQVTQTIALKSPLPVVVGYLTAAVDADGTVYFYRDIYGLDAA